MTSEYHELTWDGEEIKGGTGNGGKGRREGRGRDKGGTGRKEREEREKERGGREIKRVEGGWD